MTDTVRQSCGGTPETLWLTSQFSTKELHGAIVEIQWTRDGHLVGEGTYALCAQDFGHSHHIQSLTVESLDDVEGIPPWMALDQEDANQLYRTNAQPRKYRFAAILDCDRPREQNPVLAKLVDERRHRKEEAPAEWLEPPIPVLHDAREIMTAKCTMGPDVEPAPTENLLLKEAMRHHHEADSGASGAVEPWTHLPGLSPP